MDQLLFDKHPSAMLICKADDRKVLKANAVFKEMYGFSAADFDGHDLFFEQLQQTEKEGNVDLKSVGAQENALHLHQTKGGETLCVKIDSRPFTYQHYKARLMVITDFTEANTTIAKLRKSEALFKKLFTNAPQAMVMVDAENIIQRVNNSFQNLFGYTANELLNNNLNKIITAEEGYEAAPKISKNDRPDNQIYTQLKRYAKDGQPMDLVMGSIPVHLDGELIAGFGVYIDVTGQQKTERRLKKLLDEKQVLLEEIHHRVKNNLAIISGLLQMQIMHVDSEQFTRYIQNSQLRIQSMAIVHEMLYKSETLSHIQMNDYLKKLAAVVEETLGPDDKSIRTDTESDKIELNVNQAIPCALATSELITNAYNFAFEGRDGGQVKVTLSKEDDQVVLEVQDDGIGLPDNFGEMREKSLGMSLVENLCQQLETELEVDTGEWGTRFQFTFDKKNSPGSSSSNRI